MILRCTRTITLLILVFFSEGYAQLGPKDGEGLNPVDLERVRVGDQAPDFTLEDTDGSNISLSEFRNNKKVVLVFYRGHW